MEVEVKYGLDPFNSTRNIRNGCFLNIGLEPTDITFNSTRYIRNLEKETGFKSLRELSTPRGTLGTDNTALAIPYEVKAFNSTRYIRNPSLRRLL